MDNLTVGNQHLSPRKSIIGKLERSSFQAQRLSDVGVAFGQQITANVGLKLPASHERIVEQTRCLYLRYVFVKLRHNKLPLRDLNLTKSSRARRAAVLGEAKIIVSISEPPSAEPDLKVDHWSSPLFARQASRTRTAFSASIEPQDLTRLAARMHLALNNRSSSSNNNEAAERKASSNFNYSNLGINNGDHATRHAFDRCNNPSYVSSDETGAGSPAPRNKYIMDPTINNQIFAVIFEMIKKLRESKPEFYGDTIYEVIGIDKFSSLDSLLEVQKTICQEMTRSDVSWDRIIALFSLFGAMSLDCVRLSAPEHVGPILDGFMGFVERDLALWISQQGGWESFLYKFRGQHRLSPMYKSLAIALPILIWTVMFVFK